MNKKYYDYFIFWHKFTVVKVKSGVHRPLSSTVDEVYCVGRRTYLFKFIPLWLSINWNYHRWDGVNWNDRSHRTVEEAKEQIRLELENNSRYCVVTCECEEV